MTIAVVNPLALEMDVEIVAHRLCTSFMQNVNILRTKKRGGGNV